MKATFPSELLRGLFVLMGILFMSIVFNSKRRTKEGYAAIDYNELQTMDGTTNYRTPYQHS